MNVPKCEYCGAEIEHPFQCNYCGKYFCEKHRLPESHDCPDESTRTPLGTYQSKVGLVTFTKKRDDDTPKSNLVVTTDNKHGHRFSVPPEVYLEEKYYRKLNEARTLDDVEHTIHDYYKHHPNARAYTERIEVENRESRKLQDEMQRRRRREVEADREHE
jgi:hypothetical protein